MLRAKLGEWKSGSTRPLFPKEFRNRRAFRRFRMISSRMHNPTSTMTTSPDTVDALDLFELFSTDRESEEDGVWVDLNAKTGFKIRAFNAKVVSDLREKLMKPFQTMVRAGIPIPEDKNEEIGLKVIAGAVLADWKGVVIDGTAVDYNAETAYTLLKKLPKLAGFIASNAMESANFREEKREDDAKN